MKKGKTIYEAKGKSAEYGKYAISIYKGCSNECEYCFLQRFPKTFTNKPELKKYFKDEVDAIKIFKKELTANLDEFRKYGLFLTFSSDPFLFETINTTFQIIGLCAYYGVPLKILTKKADWVNDFIDESHQSDDEKFVKDLIKNYASFGFTLTGHDELEKNASTNKERCEAIKKLHNAGFKTFASLEPIINFSSSFKMFSIALSYCNLFLIGLESNKKYDKQVALTFYDAICMSLLYGKNKYKVYFKDSFLKLLSINRDELNKEFSFCVDRNFKL